MLIVGENRKTVQRNINKVYQNLKFKINGDWHIGCPSHYKFQRSEL